jgi:hypothetical protein
LPDTARHDLSVRLLDEIVRLLNDFCLSFSCKNRSRHSSENARFLADFFLKIFKNLSGKNRTNFRQTNARFVFQMSYKKSSKIVQNSVRQMQDLSYKYLTEIRPKIGQTFIRLHQTLPDYFFQKFHTVSGSNRSLILATSERFFLQKSFNKVI